MSILNSHRFQSEALARRCPPGRRVVSRENTVTVNFPSISARLHYCEHTRHTAVRVHACLIFVVECFLILDMHLEQCSSTQNSVFSGLSSDIQNDLIKSIAQVIRDEIKSEINFAKFVSVIADETPDISHREQMSVIFRYLTKTGIEERFVGFFRCSLERGADQLSQSILEVIDQFNCKEKLVGQSYDGAAVMSGAQGGVQTN
ncbi:Zinc finger MYM-type protein 1 [Eumeta japonica]|uniref:Zinc finger MYM-type protein 1 n=1 Tax=Eumeta variegata TaxID=151549 RepID=A0A4C1UZR8_EUMVA|nr:Zinc finger MYM-type protein 1 [Eumeta japonica]